MSKIDVLEIEATARPVVEGQGYELVDVEWKHEQGHWVLRLYMDQPVGGPGGVSPGVSLDDCARVSRELSTVLDVAGVLSQAPAYTLEVSSPGLDRPLKREADFRRFVGQKAKIRTRHPVGPVEAPRRNFAGRLIAVEAGPPVTVRIDVGDRTYDLAVDDVEKAHLVYEL
jgi:ribosome maturation factor RimP